MRRLVVIFCLFLLNVGGILLAQRGVDPAQRYFRVICLVHLTGSGQAGDPIVPEYVADGVAAARAGDAAAAARTATLVQGQNLSGHRPPAIPALVNTRPGVVAWGMQLTDDKAMAIVQLVAVDHHAFDAILADKRPEIRVFEIGKDSRAAIEGEMQKYKQGFRLDGFRVMAQ